MADPLKLYAGWRRPKGDIFAAWQEVPGCTSATFGGVYTLLMGEELKAGGGEWEYCVMPAGQRPASQTYRASRPGQLDRMMRRRF